MLRVKVDGGGTNAGRRTTSEPHDNWVCSDGHKNLGRWTRCLTKGCNERRPT